MKPSKALEMIETQKYAYVDVRTKHEFETVGHHKNSTCIPFFKSMGPPPELNPNFVKEVEAIRTNVSENKLRVRFVTNTTTTTTATSNYCKFLTDCN